jgi:hypothetical protein
MLIYPLARNTLKLVQQHSKLISPRPKNGLTIINDQAILYQIDWCRVAFLALPTDGDGDE